MKYSIRKQMTFAFVGLMAFVFFSNLLINNFFLEKYYVLRKKTVLVQAFREMNQVEGEEGFLDEEFLNRTNEICDANSTSLVILDHTFNQIVGTYDSDEMQARLWGYLMDIDSTELLQSKVKVLDEERHYTIQRNTNLKNGREDLEIWGTFDNGCFFLMRIPLESIRENARISNEFLGYFSIAGMLFSVILIWWVSTKITFPILELTNLSKRMADLDFEAKYTSGGNNEIGQLGEHFNKMSETLEHTISELKTANNELQKDIEKKTQVDEMRKEFLSNVSHELKTPIALIQGYAEGLKENITEDEQSREFYCDVIMDEANKMNQMVKKLLTLNQLEFGNDTVNMERFDIAAVVGGIVQSNRILAEQKNAKILFTQAEPVYVWADEFKIEEVVTNYISNALNHVDGDRVIEVKIQQQDEKVRVSVFNTGRPIPEEDIDKIWIKFYKVDKARTREYGGSGIGLSIVKAIMDSFHQECGVKNYDNGVEFWFELDGEKIKKDEKMC